MPRTYPTATKASEAWLRWAKSTGVARTLGGGWWQIGSSRRPIQGHHALSRELIRRGFIVKIGDVFCINWEGQIAAKKET